MRERWNESPLMLTAIKDLPLSSNIKIIEEENSERGQPERKES